MTHVFSHRLLSCSLPLFLLVSATNATLAQETLPPLPGQPQTPAAPVTPIPQLAPGGPAAPVAPQQAPEQALLPLPNLAPLPGTTPPPAQLDPGLIAERDQLFAAYQALQARLAQTQAANTPTQPQTLTAIEQASARLQLVQRDAQLSEWTATSANSLLQSLNGRPLNGVAALPAGTQISPEFAKMRLAGASYDQPSTEAGSALHNLQPNTPILKLAITQDGAWAFAWVPGKGYGYVLQSFVIPLEEE